MLAKIEIIKGDITKQKVDALAVLLLGGGVDGAIHLLQALSMKTSL